MPSLKISPMVWNVPSRVLPPAPDVQEKKCWIELAELFTRNHLFFTTLRRACGKKFKAKLFGLSHGKYFQEIFSGSLKK